MGFTRWARKNEAMVTVLASLLAIGAVVWGIVRFVVAPATLSMTITTSPLRFPWYQYQKMDHALAADSARLTDSSALALRQVRGFLRDTKSFTEVKLTNTSRQSLRNLDFRFRYVRDVDGWAIEAENLDTEEQKRISNAMNYDPSSSMLTDHAIQRLPPKSSVSIYIWGDVASSALLGEDQLTVTYDGGEGALVTERAVRGLDAFVYENAGLLVVFLLLLNVGIWAALSKPGAEVKAAKSVPHPPESGG